MVGGLEWRNHRRAAKKRARVIEYARHRPKRVQHYRQLIKLTRATLAYADQTAAQLWRAADPIAAVLWQAEFRHYRPLVERIVAQTERRVLHGEAVAANEKIVSLFEPHADIIVKGARDVQYGHKLNLTTLMFAFSSSRRENALLARERFRMAATEQGRRRDQQNDG